MKGKEIRKQFLRFFEKRNHKIIPSSPLIPENDPTVLFTTAGMQPLVPFLLGHPHPTGSRRIASTQKCLRTNDIDEVGDNTHLTFFEMLGNWSLGDYFKAEAIKWSFEFLTSTDEGVGLDPKRLYVTVFSGDTNAPKDKEAYNVWSKIFSAYGMDPESRIFFMDAESNWWSPGDNGPCGPDSEMFYDVTGKLTQGLNFKEFLSADSKQELVEIWNDVFMEYEKKDGSVIGKLSRQNVDTGSGLERVTAMVQGVHSVFETDLFKPIINKIKALAYHGNDVSERIIADHLRATVFLISEGVTPSNTDQGYVLRRLIRRSIRHTNILDIPPKSLSEIAKVVITEYSDAYPNLTASQTNVSEIINTEEEQFRKTLHKGIKELQNELDSNKHNKIKQIDTKIVFKLVTTHGLPIEIIQDEVKKQGFEMNKSSFEKDMKEHQAKSRAGARLKFKGGLADNSNQVIQYHTLTHVLLAALRDILGDHVHQAGSNITTERLRFDFTHPTKVQKETIEKIEFWVNEKLQTGGKVSCETMKKLEAENDSSIEGSFWHKYPDHVTVYTIRNNAGEIISRELCGGPHIKDLYEISGKIKIKKEESVASGVRRIKAVIESS